MYEYYAKPNKCILISKHDRLERAKELFRDVGMRIQTDGSKDTGIEITTSGARHLGAAVGTTEFQREYVQKKVAAWIECVRTLSEIAETEPHAAYSAYTHCLQSNWTFLCRTMPGRSEWFQPLEDTIRQVFIPKLLKRDVNNFERDLLSLPARMGGMGITKPTELNIIAGTNSIYISKPLVRLIKRQEFALDPNDLLNRVKLLRNVVDKTIEDGNLRKLDLLLGSDLATPAIKTALKACSEKGASSWITCYPNYDHGTVLHKGEFTDALCIRYGWPLPRLPIECKCGAFDVQHACLVDSD